MVCEKNETFEQCELNILRNAVDDAQEILKLNKLQVPELNNIISIVENFIKSKKLVCYGGTAINNILPKNEQFYDRETEIPDYDFFSFDPIKHVKELANIYYKKGFIDVEAKAGQHYGTYKLFVNFIPVADITYMSKPLFNNIRNDGIIKDGIHYCPANFLRMLVYLELSRPKGNVERWEKVFKRLVLLNKYYPMNDVKCGRINYQRETEYNKDDEKKIFKIIKNELLNQEVIFFGGYAIYLYSKYMPKNVKKQINNVPDFDILSIDPLQCLERVKKLLSKNNYVNVKIVKHKKVDEIISDHYELLVDDETIVFAYKPMACHSYNVVYKNNIKIKVATIDTMLSFYLAFIYVNRKYYDKDRILCMAQFLFQVQQKNRLKQKGLLKRFSVECYGKEKTIEEIRMTKSNKYKELKNKKNTKKYEAWFLKYTPSAYSIKNKKTRKKRK